MRRPRAVSYSDGQPRGRPFGSRDPTWQTALGLFSQPSRQAGSTAKIKSGNTYGLGAYPSYFGRTLRDWCSIIGQESRLRSVLPGYTTFAAAGATDQGSYPTNALLSGAVACYSGWSTGIGHSTQQLKGHGMEIVPTILGITFAALVLFAYFGTAAWAVSDAQKRGHDLGVVVLLFWALGPLSAVVWLFMRPRRSLADHSPDEYDNAEDAMAAASKLDALGNWDAAAAIYEDVAERWPDHAAYIQECLNTIQEKRTLAHGDGA